MSIPPTNSDSLALNSLLIDAMPGRHLVLLPNEPTFTIVAVSDEYLTAVGVQREQLVDKGVFEVFFGDGRNEATASQLFQSLIQVIRTKQTQAIADQPHQWHNAQTGALEGRVWRVVNKPVMDSCGELAYIINTVEDVTSEVKLVEVVQANRYLQLIINSFKEPLQVVKPVFDQGEIVDFRFKLTNQAYATYANTTPEELQGKRISEVFPGYFDTVSFGNPVETYQTGRPLTFEIHYNKDGLDLYNLMSTSKLDDEIVIHFTDFTHLRQLQLQLEEKIDELNRSNANLQEFAYIASHDLQEPLRKIRSFGDLLRSGYEDQLGEGATYLTRIQSAAGRMSTLIRDLLTFSRIATGPETYESVSLTQLVQLALTDLELIIAETGAKVNVGDLPTVVGDAAQLNQLFTNLLSNALKFRRTDEGGVPVIPHVEISSRSVLSRELPPHVKPARAVDWYYQIEVADNGIGFNEKYLDRIFKVFQRLHGKNQYAGTGIGLAICEKVAANHGGFITATSQVGQGATFSLFLPLL